MKQNKYDEPEFFAEYSRMPRSIHGLAAGMEWTTFRALLPDLRNKRVLDLGCGFGWHCRYAHEQGATKVVGIDLSEKMLERARATTHAPENVIKYHRTMATNVNTLIQTGFLIERLEEPKPDQDITDVQDQFRRPPFLAIAALKD